MYQLIDDNILVLRENSFIKKQKAYFSIWKICFSLYNLLKIILKIKSTACEEKSVYKKKSVLYDKTNK